MSDTVKIRFEYLLLIATLFFAFLVRMMALNEWSLTNLESQNALVAASGLVDAPGFHFLESESSSTSPVYTTLTRGVFSLFRLSNINARIVPALFGWVMLLIFALRYREGPAGSRLVWLMLLGFSPVLVTSSRVATGHIIVAAVLLTLFIELLAPHGDEAPFPILIALAVGLLLAGGQATLEALSGLAIGGALVVLLRRGDYQAGLAKRRWSSGGLIVWLAPVTTLVILTGFGTSLTGLQGVAAGLEAWVQGWTRTAGYSVLDLILLLIRSEPLILIFGSIGIIRQWSKRLDGSQLVSFWVLGATFYMIVYPGRTPFDLIWIILPLTYLAMQTLVQLLQSIGDPRSNPELLGLLGLLLTFVASGALSLVAYGSGNVLTINPNDPNLVLLLFIALAVMGLSVLVFFGIGWSWRLVIQAAGVLLILIGGAQGISSLWRLNFGNDGPQVSDLWWTTTPTRAMSLMVESLQHTAMAYSGFESELEVEIQGDLSPSMAWALRDFQKSSGEITFGFDAAPTILSAETTSGTSLPADYVGQSLGLESSRGWDSLLPPSFLRWWIKGEVPVSIETWIVWVRADIASFGDLSLEG